MILIQALTVDKRDMHMNNMINSLHPFVCQNCPHSLLYMEIVPTTFDLKTIFIHVESTMMRNLGTDQRDVSKHGITNNNWVGIMIHYVASIKYIEKGGEHYR